MAATVTDNLKKTLANLLLNDVSSNANNNYFIGIGKADAWPNNDNAVNPSRTLSDERLLRSNLQSVKLVEAASMVTERYNWSSGIAYSRWTDNQVGLPSSPYYVMTEDQEVYICLQQGRNALGQAVPSTIKPSFQDAGVSSWKAFKTSDGYVWKFLYQISVSEANNFLSANFVPIKSVSGDSGSLTAFELQQLKVQKAAVEGQVTGIRITNGGSGYTSAPAVTIKGNGSGAEATATVSGGSIVKIEMNNESAAMGSGYDFATIEIAGGGGAQAQAIVSPVYGIGNDPRDDLKVSSMMMTIKPDGAENDDFIVENEFRQIGLFRDLQLSDSSAFLTNATSKTLRFISLDSSSGVFTDDALIRGQTSGAGAFIDDVDGTDIYFHQNEVTGFTQFSVGEEIRESSGEGKGSITSITNPETNAFTGDLLYIENRARVLRDVAQQEDIKIIIKV